MTKELVVALRPGTVQGGGLVMWIGMAGVQKSKLKLLDDCSVQDELMELDLMEALEDSRSMLAIVGFRVSECSGHKG